MNSDFKFVQTLSHQILRLLLEKKCIVAPKDVFDRSPLHAAAENGHVTCVEQLCVTEPGHVNDRDERGLTPLHLAARESHRYAGLITWKCSLHLKILLFLALFSGK